MTKAELKEKLKDISQEELESYMREMCESEGGDWCNKSNRKPLIIAIILATLAIACWLYYKQRQ